MHRCFLIWSALLLLGAAGAAPGEELRFERVAGRSYRLTLPGELGSSWRALNVGRLQVRTAGGSGSLDQPDLPAARDLELTLGTPGCSLLVVDVGPQPATGDPSPAWQRVTHCWKVVVCDGEGGGDSGVVLTAKTGSRIEIRPLFNPARLLAGADLPVRLYFDGEAVEGGEVEALGPGAVRTTARGDRFGIAVLRISRSGRWRLVFPHQGATAELIFDVPES
jgi:Domain of unknown function (DUF4198)